MPHLKENLIGQVFGRLTIIEEVADRYSCWKCQCSCGNFSIVSTSALKRNKGTQSCGCYRREKAKARKIDLVNQRFGHLVVVSSANPMGIRTMWTCQCDCGKILDVMALNLRNARTTSCGCYNNSGYREKYDLIDINTAFSRVYIRYYERAINKNLPWELSPEEAKYLFSKNCYYCGIEPQKIQTFKKFNDIFIYNGIDRVDNNLGYILSNCVPCCYQCNWSKGSISKTEFQDWIERVFYYTFLDKVEQ